MINLEQLKERFPTQNVPPYGECVIVPGTEFDSDWEAMLDEGGYGCIFTDINSKPVTLVLTIKRHGDSKRTVYEPRAESRGPTKEPLPVGLSAMKGPQWARDDEDRLVKRIGELKGKLEEKCRVLSKEFKGRSPNAILQKFHKVEKQRKLGRGKPGPKPGQRKKAVSPALQKEMEKALENVCPDCGLPKDLCCCDEEKKESLRQEPRTPVQKQSARALEKLVASGLMQFETYCRKCGTRRTVEDYDVWRVCPICLEPLIVWNVQESL
jgi:hypothetical protein